MNMRYGRPVEEVVKARTYRSAKRDAQAAATRLAILRSARELFVSQGYATTVADVATRAGVAVDTVYASVGRKPALVRAVIDMVLASDDEPLAAAERAYVRRIAAARDAADKIGVYARALAKVMPTVAPLQEALHQAGRVDTDCARAWSALVERRAAHMVLFAADLRATGQLREDLTNRHVADIVWATNSAEYFLLLRQRGWSPRRYGSHLADLWTRMLLRGPC